MLGRLHRSCMLLSLVPSQVSLLHSLSLCLLFFHFAFSICFPFLLFCLVSSNMFRICLTLSFVLMISYLETTPSITLPWIWSYESFIPGLNICNLVTGKPSFTKKQADLFFPPDFADDFPVAMQVSATPFFFLNLLLLINNP